MDSVEAETVYNRARLKSQAEQDMIEQEEREYNELCHQKVLYQFSGQAARDNADRSRHSETRLGATE